MFLVALLLSVFVLQSSATEGRHYDNRHNGNDATFGGNNAADITAGIRTSFGPVGGKLVKSADNDGFSGPVAGGSDFLPRSGPSLFGAAPSGDSVSSDSVAGLGFAGSQGRLGNQFLGSSVTNAGTGPIYEDHILPRSGAIPRTKIIVNNVTKTHTLRVPSTSDVWVTSVTMIKVSVTQLSTRRQFVPLSAGTVTSVVRVTVTPVEIETQTVQIAPTKTHVSIFTHFKTITQTTEFWQPIVHVAVDYEVRTVPVIETQILLQRLYTTVTDTVTIATTVFPAVPRVGVVPAATYLPQYQ